MSLIYFEKWKKFGAYKLSEHKEKGLYIVPTSNKLNEYNPFEVANDILFELLSIGMDIAKNIDVCYQISDFVNKFGLLGFGQAVIEKEYADCTAKLYENNPFGLMAIHYTDLMDLIFPFDKYSHRIVKGNEALITTLWGIKYTDGIFKECVVFDSDYSENVLWIEHYAKYLYNNLLNFYEGRSFEHKFWNVKKYIAFKDSLKEVWQFDSLKSAVDIMFIELLTADKPKIKLCKRCKKPFIVQVQKSEYCSASCRNVLNVKKSRWRKKSLI